MIKIGLVGAPGAGKTCLAAGVFHACKVAGINVELVQEFVREELNKGWELQGVADQFRILLKQREREDILPESVEVMLTDSPTILTFLYAPSVSLDLKRDIYNLSALYEEFVRDLTRYDFLYLVKRAFEEVVNDGTRKQSTIESDAIQIQLKALLDIHKVAYKEIPGNDDSIKTILDDIRCSKDF